MKNTIFTRTAALAVLAGCLGLNQGAWAADRLISLYARQVWINPVTGSIGTSQGDSSLGRLPMWGYSQTLTGTPSVPGPRINVPVGDNLVIRLYNQLPAAAGAASQYSSVVIPGLNGSQNAGQPVEFGAGDPNYAGRIRSLVREDERGGSYTEYRWNNVKSGTYAYHSGTHMAVQVQMGLYGMIAVANGNRVYPGYEVPSTRDTTVIFSEIDPALHWAVHTNGYGPGKSISSTMHSDPSIFLINGRAGRDQLLGSLSAGGKSNERTLFRMANFCWDSRIPTLAGPVPFNLGGGVFVPPGSAAHHLTVIAEDGNLYPYPQTAYAPNLGPLKTMDALFTPQTARTVSYVLYDHRLGLSNPSSSTEGGMFARWLVAQ